MKIVFLAKFSRIFPDLFLQVVCVSQDSFYRELDSAERAKADKGLFNFDHPSAFNETQLLQVLQNILMGEMVEIPVYDYKNNTQ